MIPNGAGFVRFFGTLSETNYPIFKKKTNQNLNLETIRDIFYYIG